MCTALNIKTTDNKYFFGRNMDLGYNFNQSVMLIPKNYTCQSLISKNNVTGMGTVIDNHPMLADGMNDKGLACAGLNFAGNAYYEKEPVKGKINIAPYDFIPWVLFNFESVSQVESEIKNIELIDRPINEKTPVPTLHWMISDKTGVSIVAEKTINGLKIYKNPVYVMTNDPTFDWHLTNLNEYLYLTPKPAKNTRWSDKELKPIGIGSGTLGIPGDFSSVSRFIRIAYLRAHMPELNTDEKAVTQFFHMLDYVKMTEGGIVTDDIKNALTIYSCCMDLEQGIYYFKTYENSRINAIKLKSKNNNSSIEIEHFPYSVKQDVKYIN